MHATLVRLYRLSVSLGAIKVDLPFVDISVGHYLDAVAGAESSYPKDKRDDKWRVHCR